MADARTAAREAVRLALGDAAELCRKLKLDKGAQRQAGGLKVLCPWHKEHTPSCSVQDKQGGVLAHCFGCGNGGDAFALVAAVNGLDAHAQFGVVLELAARLAGVPLPSPSSPEDTEAARRAYAAAVQRAQEQHHEPEPERTYPPDAGSFWDRCRPLTAAAEAWRYLDGRKLEPARVAELGLARVLPDGELPRWARYQGRSWRETGHELVVPAYDAAGDVQSVRAWRVSDDASPKRLPPAGHRASGLVLANGPARALLADPVEAVERAAIADEPVRVVVAEGEPDWLACSLRWPALHVLGMWAGSWSAELAARIPDGSRVTIRTDHDQAGDKYANQIAETLKDRCRLLRAEP